jgi:transposase
MRGNSHVRFGGRPAETGRPKGRHRAAGRPYLGQRAVDQVRRDEWNAHDRSHTKTGKWIKGTRWSLLKSPTSRASRSSRCSAKCSRPTSRCSAPSSSRRNCGCSISSRTRHSHRRTLDAWLAWASRSRLEPFIKLARTIRRHRQGILAAIRLGLSNARLEGLNSRIRLISHRSFGFHSPGPLIALAYLCCAGIVIDLPR